MNIVGLDLSLTATGVAFADGITFATIAPKAKGVERLAFIRKAVTDAVTWAATTTDLAVIEGYAYGRTNQAAPLGELGGVVRLHLYDLGIPFIDVAPMRLKKWATGKGNADKDAVLVKAARRWKGVADNNQADAAFLRDMAVVHYLGTPTKAQAEILGQIDWPDLSTTNPPEA